MNRRSKKRRGSLSPQPKKNQPGSPPDSDPSDFEGPDAPQGGALVRAQYSGPLPLPSHFEHYERILPGAADRIVTMGEAEQVARQEHEASNTKLEIFKTRWGFVAWGLTLAAVVFLAYIGERLVAAILGSGIGLSGIARILTAIRGGSSSD